MLIIEKLPTRYSEGSATVVANEVTVTPTNALWYGNVWGDDLFFDPAQPLVPPQRIASVNEDGTLTLAYPWPGDTMDEAPYEVRYIGIIERSTAQTRKVLEQLGEVSAYYDIQVDTLADRDAYDARPAGYRVMVSDVGDGRAAIFMKKSSADADWSDPAYISGPVGPEGPVGDPGVTWQGDWSSATEYQENDGVLYNGSSWRAKQTHTNQAPPNLPTTENTYWKLIAAKGTDGTGTGDVVGPGSSVDSRIAVFDGTTGKLIKDGGVGISGLEPARTKATQGDAEAGTGTDILGWAPEQIAQAIAALAPSGGGDVDPNLVAFNTFKIADLDGQRLGFAGGFADPFDDDTGIDPALSDNYAYDAGNDRFMPSEVFPRISDGTPSAPIGNVSTIANINDDNPATTATWTGQNLNGQSVVNRRVFQLDLGSIKLIGRVELKQLRLALASDSTNNAIFTSEDGASWTQYGAAAAWSTSPSDYVQEVSRLARYVAYVPEATGWSGGYNHILGDLNVYGAVPGNMTLVSDSVAVANPATIRALVEIHATEAVTANTDFKLGVSRDDGTTFTDAVLEPYFGNFYQSVIDVSGQPSGTDLRVRFQTLNNKNVGVSGWFAQVL